MCNLPKRSYLLLIFSAILGSAVAQIKVLHYDETTGFDHNTRNQSFALFTALGNAEGYDVVQDSDGSEFTMSKLSEYDLVIFSNTSGSQGLNDSQKAALEWYIDVRGGSLMGIHAASDTYRHSSANGGNTGVWDWYAETLGGSVQQSPNHTSNNHVDTMHKLIEHPSIENMTFPWVKEEEYYYWENGYLNEDIIQIFEVEETGSNSYDEVRPMGWFTIKDSGAKIFYTALGHKRGNFTGDFPQFEQLMQDAVLWLTPCCMSEEICDGIDNNQNGQIDEHLTNEWVGPDQGYWYENRGYWSLCQFPNSCNKVIVNAPKKVTIKSGNTGFAYELEISGGSELIVEMGAQFIVEE